MREVGTQNNDLYVIVMEFHNSSILLFQWENISEFREYSSKLFIDIHIEIFRTLKHVNKSKLDNLLNSIEKL